MSFVYLDTQILIWGIKEESSSGQEIMIPKAKAFFRWLQDNNVKVAIPSVVLGELLLGVPVEKHGDVYSDVMEQNFISHPYDALAAVTAARVWIAARDAGTIADILQDPNRSRAAIRADCQIVGIAVSRKGSCIYSHDSDIRRLAEGFIAVRELPEPEPLQLPLSSG